MNAADVRAFVDRAQAAWNAHDRETYVGLSANDQVTTAPGGMRLEGRQGAEQFYDAWQSAFPDTRVEIRSVICDESNACVEADFVGTHQGTMMSPQGAVPATGRRVSVPFVHLFSLRDGKIATNRLYFDTAEMAAQLGLVPSPATA
jgi:steroid delta-isomerase-like uncharacterized protein